MITKEMIEARKTELAQSIEQKRAEMNALVGAVQDCNFWLAQIAEQEAKEQV